MNSKEVKCDSLVNNVMVVVYLSASVEFESPVVSFCMALTMEEASFADRSTEFESP